jgi:isocitrate lyase
VPNVVERISNTFRRADEIQWSKGVNQGDYGYVGFCTYRCRCRSRFWWRC